VKKENDKNEIDILENLEEKDSELISLSNDINELKYKMSQVRYKIKEFIIKKMII